MRAHELGLYDPAEDHQGENRLGDTRTPPRNLRDLNREKRIRQARALQDRREQRTIALIFGDPEVEREELELRKERAEAKQAEYEAEQARLEIEQIRAETLATMADAQKARADAKLTAAKAWNE